MAQPKRRRWGVILGVGLGTLVIVGALGLVGLQQVYSRNLQPVSQDTTQQLVTVAQGETAQEIAAQLKQKELIRSAWSFEWYVRVQNLRDKLQAGDYKLSPNQSVQEMATIISSGKVATDVLTILPAQRVDQIKKAFIKAGYTEAQVSAAFEPSRYSGHPALASKPAAASLEGYLYPDTFQKTATTPAEAIVRLSLDLMAKQLTNDVKNGLIKHGLTVHEGVILASMVEKEVSNPNDRPIVAQVFLKRLKEDIRLGSDVTAFYGAVIAGATPAVDYDSPYNTRMHGGLPVGPISNVSAVSLRAVAFPANTNYLYFVAGDDGTTHFTKTLAEHEAATAQYCKKLCE